MKKKRSIPRPTRVTQQYDSIQTKEKENSQKQPCPSRIFLPRLSSSTISLSQSVSVAPKSPPHHLTQGSIPPYLPPASIPLIHKCPPRPRCTQSTRLPSPPLLHFPRITAQYFHTTLSEGILPSYKCPVCQ
ncbi:hypothetical protein COCCADRAFT_81730 [Bipolaris zeicola 26-R-13]|uniref:Uncharacterized protein n=1 Tax=Cochliobolus carbonum (strain 26-R-13) TaxID=930089 RepID=W6YME5_COCC2|nr:uncharacterized protein COCCADRAFT_81730 [Bipolaris zeicola 26-R-13]EUC38980.1 hypothetical protein COCCADRAFT_81730 [Bipolaris zeicola 26-R-13]